VREVSTRALSLALPFPSLSARALQQLLLYVRGIVEATDFFNMCSLDL
jgi:hypothetical protein